MISLLIVNFRSAALAAGAIATARAASSLPLQVVVVDNSCDSVEAAALEPHADQLVVSDVNRGYAGGINLGRAACTGEVIVIANPDVVFSGQAVDHLAASLEGRVAAAGPALFWDTKHEWHLPPGDLLTGWGKVDEVLATRSPAWAEQRDRRRYLRRLAFWTQGSTTPVPVLSGAVMAVRARDLDEAGGFDERFRLYFEETDFLRRLSAVRKRIVHVPDARCRHLYNQSAGGDDARAAGLYAESELRYLEKWIGPLAARLLKRFELPPRGQAMAELTSDTIDLPEDGLVVEASPLASFATAAGHFATSRRVTIPAEILESFRGGALHLRVVRRNGDVLQTCVRYTT